MERFPYQNGLLVSYVDNAFNDNNTIDHPGAGLVLPVDARPAPVVLSGNVLLGNRRQPFDATFGQEATDAVTFHRNGSPRSSRRHRPSRCSTTPTRSGTGARPTRRAR